MRKIVGGLLAVFALVAGAAAQEGVRPGAGVGAGSASLPLATRRENPAISVQDLVRIDGQAKSPLRGLGIVLGLRGTGDAGTELSLARPLAQIYANNGNPIPDLKELAKARAAAVVNLWTEIPEEGGRTGDSFDIYVQVTNSASSLKGGMLVISPLLHPLPNRQEVFGFASGPIVIEDPEIPTVGVIRGGLTLVRDIPRRPIGDAFNLIVRPEARSFSTTQALAGAINNTVADLENAEAAEQIAVAVDDTVVRVTIPPHERANPANFIAAVMTRRFSPTLLDLPAMVIVNERTGNIVVTADVEISPVTVGSDKLVVTTVIPPPVPSPQDPLVSRGNWTEFGSTATGSERARLADLLEAFKRLNVPVREQITILEQIHRSGRLHARFVRE